MRILTPVLIGLILSMPGLAQAATTQYQILFTAIQGPDGTGTFTYDNSPSAENLSDIDVQFGAGLSGSILTITHPFDTIEVDLFLFQILSGPQDISRSIAFADPDLVGFDYFSFTDDISDPPPYYEFTTQGLSGSGTLSISAVPIPAALPLFGSALGLLGISSWKKRPSQAA